MSGIILSECETILVWKPQNLKIVKTTIHYEYITDFLMNDINVPTNIEFILIYCIGRSSFGFFPGGQIGTALFTVPFFIAKVLAHTMLINTLVLFSNDYG